MENLYQELQGEFGFSALCDKIELKEERLVFIPKQGFHSGNRSSEIYEIKEVNNRFIVTDNGMTYSNLDHIFELSEPDVQKNLINISNQSGIKWYGKEFIFEFDENENFCTQILTYLQGINFIYALHIFYGNH